MVFVCKKHSLCLGDDARRQIVVAVEAEKRAEHVAARDDTETNLRREHRVGDNAVEQRRGEQHQRDLASVRHNAVRASRARGREIARLVDRRIVKTGHNQSNGQVHGQQSICQRH